MPPKGTTTKGKKGKGARKKIIDAFLKKEWYVVKVPTNFPTKAAKFRVGYSPAKKAGAKKQLDQRTFVINFADLHDDPASSLDRDRPDWKKFKFVTEEVFGQQLLTQWHGMDITRDHRCSLIRKWHTMIECLVETKTTDGYVLRIKALAFTKRQPEQVSKNCYAKHSQVRQIRAKMGEIIKSNIASEDLTGVIRRLSKSTIGRDIKKSCQLIFPLKTCIVEKVKVLRKPKRDVARLMKMHDLKSGFDELVEDDEASDEEDVEEDDDDDAEME